MFIVLFILFLALPCFCTESEDIKAAIALQNKGEYAKAQSIYLKLLEKEKLSEKENKNALLLNNLGFCQQKLQKFKLAEKNFTKALRFAPNDAQIYNNFASLKIAQNNLEAAEKLYLEAINKDPEYPFTYNNLAFLYQKQNKFFKAINFYKQGIDKAPIAEFYYNLGLLYFDMKKYDDMLETFKKALELQPQYAEVYYSLALTHYYNLLELNIQKQEKEFKKAFNRLNNLNQDLAQKFKNSIINKAKI